MIDIEELDLKEVLKLFWDKKVWIIAVTIVFAIMGVIKVNHFTTPIYEAKGKMIGARNEETVTEGAMVTPTELSTTSSLSETYAELIKSDLVVNQVINNLDLKVTTKQLSSMIELTPVTKVYYQVSVKSTDRETVAQITNEFMKVFSDVVKEFYQIDGIDVVDKATTPQTAINMSVSKNAVIFGGVGFGLVVCLIMVMYMLNNTVTNSEQIKHYTKLPTLATVPKYSGKEDLITLRDSKSPYAESIKILRTNLQYMYDGEDLKTVAITSSLPEEGKSWLTANLAVAFANSGKKTLIIDADMRRGKQHKLFKVRKTPGLSEFLKSSKETTELVAIRGKRVAKTGLARLLSMVNCWVKIEKIPAVANLIYKDEYFDAETEGNARVQHLRKAIVEEVVGVMVEPEEKKTRKRQTKTVETKKTRKTKKVEEKVEDKNIATKQKEEAKKVSEFIHSTNIDNLYVLAAGRETMDSSELLSNTKMKKALEELKKEYDMILVDTPPVSVVSDGFLISRMVDTNIIVLKHGNTEINELNKIKNNIQEIGGNVIGTVINKTPDAKKKYYHTYYNRKEG